MIYINKYLSIYRIIGIVAFLFAMPLLLQADNSKKIVINEFLALNSTGLQDEDGEYSDWIELYNPGDVAVNLGGWYLTDNPDKMNKWTFPSVIIAPDEYLLVFASDKNRRVPGKELHSNFKLSGSGEYLAIVESDNTISDEFNPFFPAQQTDISYGLYLGQYTFFTKPTPGYANELSEQVLAPAFSKERGFYGEQFSVTLSVGDPDTKIYYTTDGTRPTAANNLYSGSISITTTTPLSAVGIKNGQSSPVVSHTYFFIKDIINQPANPAGYPDKWGALNYGVGSFKAGEGSPADYEMDPEICNSPLYKDHLNDAFLAIPSVCIVTNPGYIFSHSTDPETGGIYIYTGDTGNPSSNGGGKLGREWERPASIEFYEPSTGKQFQINCGLRLHGGNSRKPYNSTKHSFRVSFRSQYGASKLNFKLFNSEDATQRFDHLVFRAGYNFSWVKNSDNERLNAQYTYDSFAKRTQLNMGHPAAHDQFIHLFINGLYWGLYNISEKINDDFIQAYLGGKDEDYDVINDDGIVDGNLTAYNQMLSLAKAGKYNDLISQKLLNMENFIDYMLMNFYIGNSDWGKNNWFTGRSRVNPGKGFHFFSWDAENSLTSVSTNTVSTFEGPLREILFGSSSGSTSGGLNQNAEFKLLFADRIQKHFFNLGALVPDNTMEAYLKITDEIDLPIILESARWGDYRKDMIPHNDTRILYTRNDHWLPRKEQLVNDYFPQRTEIVFNQLKSMGLYTSVEAPAFSDKGGEKTDPFDLVISASAGEIYYTIDNSDPRESGTSVTSSKAKLYKSPLHVVGEGTVKARAKVGSNWSALADVSFTGGRKDLFVDESHSGLDSEVGNENRLYIVDDILYCTLSADANVSIELYTPDGRKVYGINEFLSAGSHQLPINIPLDKSVYLYKAVLNKAIVTGKFIR